MRADDEVVAKTEVVALQKQIRELQRVLGKKTLENEILREAVKIAHEKNSSRGCRRCPRTICREAGCSGFGRISIAAQSAPEGTGQVTLELLQAREAWLACGAASIGRWSCPYQTAACPV